MQLMVVVVVVMVLLAISPGTVAEFQAWWGSGCTVTHTVWVEVPRINMGGMT